MRIDTYLEVDGGGGGAGEEARQHQVQRQVARAPRVAAPHLDVLDLRRCNTNKHETHTYKRT